MAVQVREPEAVPSTQPWGAMVTMARTAGPMDPMGLTPAPMGPTEPMESMAPMGPTGSLDPMATPAMASLVASPWGPLDTSMPLWAMGQARPTASGGMICNSAARIERLNRFRSFTSFCFTCCRSSRNVLKHEMVRLGNNPKSCGSMGQFNFDPYADCKP